MVVFLLSVVRLNVAAQNSFLMKRKIIFLLDIERDITLEASRAFNGTAHFKILNYYRGRH
jgi:hypothetical protein